MADDATFTMAASGRDGRHLKLDTVVRLRWLAVIGQSAAVAFVHLELDYRLPFGGCILVIATAAIVNLWLRIRYPASHRLGADAATALLAFDILQLAGLLYLTGGLENPFAILFLAPILISATALTPGRTLALGILGGACATALAVSHLPLPWSPEGGVALPPLYIAGIWTAILLAIAFTGVFAYRVAKEGRLLSGALAATELVLAREQHLSQLDGLAAAAAHELGTPLATIALVARELDLAADPESPTASDLRLLREQVERCRTILSKLTSLAGEDGGFLERMSLEHLIEEVVGPERPFDIDIRVACAGDGPEPACRRSPGLLYGLGNLVGNAADFARCRIAVDARWSVAQVIVEICDDGPGFPSEILLRAGEPYITTRGVDQAGQGTGHGLGLFIAKTLIERAGGQLSLANGGALGGALARIVWTRESFEKQTAYITDLSPAGV